MPPKPLRKIALLLVMMILAMPMQVQGAPRLQKTGNPIVVVIDPGHGGENNGTTENGFLEKDMTLKTAKVMYDELSKFEGLEVYLTRTDDRELSLKDRAVFASEHHADFLISLHYNASESHTLFGAETWISLNPKFHSAGYQLGTSFLREFREMGLVLRGIKTRRHSKGNDYYGILREAVSRDVPAIIVEHCHVDHERDVGFCDSSEDLEAFGRADARAVAKYFGLKSTALGVDYSEEAKNLPEVTEGVLVPRAVQDETHPGFCHVSLKEAFYDKDQIEIYLSAEDPDSHLIYYAYSLDGGKTFSDSIPLPDGDILTGEYPESMEILIDVPDGTKPELCLRVYNPYDLDAVSNVLTFPSLFQKPAEAEGTAETVAFREVSIGEAAGADPAREGASTDRILRILLICIAVAFLLFLIFLVAFLANSPKRRRRKRAKKNSREGQGQTK